MSEVIKVTDIKKEAGYMYFVTSNEEGFLVINKTKAGRPKKIKEDIAKDLGVPAEIVDADLDIPIGVG